MISFPRKESQVPRDTGHSASVAALLLAVTATSCVVRLCHESCSLLGLRRSVHLPRSLRVEGLRRAFFTGRCSLCHCPCPTKGGRAGLCCLSLGAGQERRCEAVLTPSNWRLDKNTRRGISARSHPRGHPGGSEEKLSQPMHTCSLTRGTMSPRKLSQASETRGSRVAEPTPACRPSGSPWQSCSATAQICFLREERNFPHQRVWHYRRPPGHTGAAGGEAPRRPSFLLVTLCPQPQHRWHLGCHCGLWAVLCPAGWSAAALPSTHGVQVAHGPPPL